MEKKKMNILNQWKKKHEYSQPMEEKKHEYSQPMGKKK